MDCRMKDPTVLRNAVSQAIKGMFVGDAVSMPVHWYYDVAAIKRDFEGWIAKYERPKDDHPTSILRTSNKGGSGRADGKSTSSVIGHVILHGKENAWSEAAVHSHYHQGMQAGDNTLNCHCAFRVLESLAACNATDNDAEVIKQIFVDYVKFMTTPDSHNDTYAESWHRLLFSDWVKNGRPTDKEDLYEFLTKRSKSHFAKPADKQLEVIGAFVVPTPIILYFIDRPLEEVTSIAETFLSLTHPTSGIVEPFRMYVSILHSVVRGSSLKEEAEKALLEFLGPASNAMLKTFDATVERSTDKLSAFQDIGRQLGIACYINSSFALLLYICRYYHQDFESGILTNVNVGGENCHRGSVVGTLLAASIGASGKSIPTKWTDGLAFNNKIDNLKL